MENHRENSMEQHMGSGSMEENQGHLSGESRN